MKKKLTFLLALIIILAVTISPANAAPSQSDPVTTAPLAEATATTTATYSSIIYAYNVISISSGLAKASNYISCGSNVDKITISCYIQKYDNGWKTVAHKRTTTYSNRASLYNSVYVSSGYPYRVRTYFYAYDGSVVESTTSTSSTYY